MMETFRLSTYLFDGTYIGTKQVEHSKRRYWPRSMIYDQGKLYFLFGLNIDSADYPQYEWGTLDTCSGQISLRVATDKVWDVPTHLHLPIVIITSSFIGTFLMTVSIV